MDFKEQAQTFYFNDALKNYAQGNHKICIALCRILLVLDKRDENATELLEKAQTALYSVL